MRVQHTTFMGNASHHVALDSNTPGGFWQRVGEILERCRIAKGWMHPIDVEHHGGPTYSIVHNHEDGQIKTIGALERHAEALGLTIIDVLRAAVADVTKAPTPEASRVLRTFERTSIEGREALLAVVRALEARMEPEQTPRDKSR